AEPRVRKTRDLLRRAELLHALLLRVALVKGPDAVLDVLQARLGNERRSAVISRALEGVGLAVLEAGNVPADPRNLAEPAGPHAAEPLHGRALGPRTAKPLNLRHLLLIRGAPRTRAGARPSSPPRRGHRSLAETSRGSGPRAGARP